MKNILILLLLYLVNSCQIKTPEDRNDKNMVKDLVSQIIDKDCKTYGDFFERIE